MWLHEGKHLRGVLKGSGRGEMGRGRGVFVFSTPPTAQAQQHLSHFLYSTAEASQPLILPVLNSGNPRPLQK